MSLTLTLELRRSASKILLLLARLLCCGPLGIAGRLLLCRLHTSAGFLGGRRLRVRFAFGRRSFLLARSQLRRGGLLVTQRDLRDAHRGVALPVALHLLLLYIVIVMDVLDRLFTYF